VEGDALCVYEQVAGPLNATTRAGPIRANDLAHRPVLEAYIKTLKAENET
jgi:hypothetical protein